MIDGLSDIRWLGARKSSHVWEIEYLPDALIDPEQLVIRLHESDTPLQRLSDNPLQIITPAGVRGGHFEVEYQNHRYPLLSRQIPLEGSSNCRDLGGYIGADHKTVRWRRLLRSGHWSDLSPADLSYISDIDIALLCDFRSEEEQRRQPPKLPKQLNINVMSLPIKPGSSKSFLDQFNERLSKGTEQDAHQIMCEVNRELVLKHSAQYQRMFELILQQKEGAMVINCTAGKDRTGLGAALILLALGVSEKTVVQDYLKTQIFTKNHNRKWAERYIKDHGISEILIKSMLTVRPEYIESAFTAIREQHDTVENYIMYLGVDQNASQELRARFLV